MKRSKTRPPGGGGRGAERKARGHVRVPSDKTSQILGDSTPQCPAKGFCIPGHEWKPEAWKPEGEVLRRVNGWVLLRLPTTKDATALIESGNRSATHRARHRSARAKSNLIAAAGLPTLFDSSPEEKKATKLASVLDDLATIAKNDQDRAKAAEALELLRWLAEKGCKKLMEATQARDQVARDVAPRHLVWPMNVARKSSFDMGIKECKAFLVGIGLGAESGRDCDEIRRGGVQSTARKRGAWQMAERLLATLTGEWKRTHTIDGERTKEFSVNTAFWLKKAKEIFNAAYPEPHQIEELRNLSRPARRERPGWVRFDAWEQIANAMRLQGAPGYVKGRVWTELDSFQST